MTDRRTWLLVAVMAMVTALLRFLPFLVWGENKKVPKIIEKMGKVLPYSVMGMLVVYCLREVNVGSISGFLPELIASLVVGVLYVWKRNTLVSIISGTVSYMILVQMVF